MQFGSGKAFEKWLSKNHSKSKGIWVRMYKKHSGVNAIKGPEMLDVLLCYGWITGQARRGNDKYALWRVCPRRPKSIWSEINTRHAERLITEGRMQLSGLKQIENAKKDGRWNNAYAPQRTAKLPSDFIREVNKNKKAKTFLKTLNRSNTYWMIFRLHHTKEGKRKEKIASIIAMLEKGKIPGNF